MSCNNSINDDLLTGYGSTYLDESTSLLYTRENSLSNRRLSISSHKSLKKDKIGDAWHNHYSGFECYNFFDIPILSLVPSLIITILLWNMASWFGLPEVSMHVLAVFLGFIVALLISNYEVSSLIAIALSILALTQNLMCKDNNGNPIICKNCSLSGACNGYKAGFHVIVSGFTNDVVWLVFCAFHIGKAVEISGLGKRIAMHLVSMMGGSSLGLGLSFCFAELVLAPFIPSNSARGGGVVAPIVISVIQVINSSLPAESFYSSSAISIQGYLILIASQANLISSSLFLTGLAPNPLISAKAYQAFKVEFGFMQWLSGSFVPGFITLLIMPIFLLWLIKPKGYDGEVVKYSIQSKLNELGTVTLREWKLIIVLLSCLTLWSTESHTGLNNALIGFFAMTFMILSDILSWEDISKNTKAWDTLFWLSGFIVLAEQLSDLKISDWLGHLVAKTLLIEEAGPIESSIFLAVIYFFSMYLFSSATGHIVALVAAFFEAGQKLNAPPYLLIALLAYFSSLCCCMTSYSTGSFAIYYSQGYIPRTSWFKIGFFMALFYITIYLTIGISWWKLLGWW